MNRYIFICSASLVLLFSSMAAAQDQPLSPAVPVDPDSKRIWYRAVVEEPGDPVYLYKHAMKWFNYYYKNPTSVFSIQDQINGKLEGNGRMSLYFDDEEGNRRDAGLVVYKILIEFKDDRYRYTVSDFNLKGTSRYPLEKWLNKEDPIYNPQWDIYLYQIDTTMQRLTTTLKEKMKPVVEKTDEW